MPAILVTGMSGTGKSTVLAELERCGFDVVDTDECGLTVWDDAERGFVWREAEFAELLERAGPRTLYVAGCVSNQGLFYPAFGAVVLLSAPADVLLDRIARRTTNAFGKTRAQRELILRDLADVEPLLRATCTHELDATRPVGEIAEELISIAGMAKKKKLTEAERIEWEAQRSEMLANAQRTRELAERAQAKLDAQTPRE